MNSITPQLQLLNKECSTEAINPYQNRLLIPYVVPKATSARKTVKKKASASPFAASPKKS